MAGDGGVDSGHRRQVAGIALDLFDGLRPLHTLGPDSRFLLHAAALLLPPDGQTGGKGIGKKIRGRILLDPDLPLEGNERVMVGLVAGEGLRRRGGVRSREYRGLDDGDRRAVRHLAAFLRIAYALDVTRRGAVRRVIAEITPEAVLLTVLARVAMEEEVAEALWRSALLEELSGRRVVIRWSLKQG
jgi:exopolyphosphatase/guanosine-5'-triphosphate,3'-diphosphate pyrophosphatase